MPEQESVSPEQLNEFLFMQIVMMFQGAAFQHMGKVMNPVTQKVERDLAQAKNAIDILGMLEAKTQGNLSENEKQLLEHALYELRMNYVDEANKEEAPEGTEEGEGAEPQEDEGAGEPEAGAPEEAEGSDADAPESEDSEATETGEPS